MKSIPRHLATAMVYLASLHSASGLPLDFQQDEPAPTPPFPMIRNVDGDKPLTALLQPQLDVPCTGSTGLPTLSRMPPGDAWIGSSFLERTSMGSRPVETGQTDGKIGGRFTLSPSLADFSLPPDIELRALPQNAHFNDNALNSYRAGLDHAPTPITIPEPRSASLLAIGLAGLGLRACWGAWRN